MSGTLPVSTRAPSRGGLFWALVPAVLLSTGVGGLAWLASLAARDPSFALERDYYDRAVHWDRQQAEWAENARLGHRVSVELQVDGAVPEVVTKIVDRSGAPLRGARVEVEAFANSRSAERRTLGLVEGEGGTYRAELPGARSGLWELRLTVVQDGNRFTHVARVDVPGSSGP